MSIPPLHPEAPPKSESAPVPQGPECMDCGSTLGGKFCHYCGQRKQRRVASVFSLAGEFVTDIFNWDSRVWRTLWPLFAKPGYLTKTFMEGKRERHVPPIRLYLISSIIFFIMVSMSPLSVLGKVSDVINFKMGGTVPGLELGIDSKITTESFKAVANALNDRGVIELPTDTESVDEQDDIVETDEEAPIVQTIDDREVIGVDAENVKSEIDDAGSEAPADLVPDQANQNATSTDEGQASVSEDDESSDEFDINDVEISTECEELRDQEYSPEYEFLRMPAYRFCLSVTTWRGLIAFLDELADSLPKTLLILLPLMALVNKLLYLFAGRFYVEHLLYYVHNYSFLFLFSVLLAGIGKLFSMINVDISGFLYFFGTLYTIYYFFKSMRVVYGQGFIFTLLKWLTLMFAFFFLVSVVLVSFTLATAALHGL